MSTLLRPEGRFLLRQGIPGSADNLAPERSGPRLNGQGCLFDRARECADHTDQDGLWRLLHDEYPLGEVDRFPAGLGQALRASRLAVRALAGSPGLAPEGEARLAWLALPCWR